MSFQMDAGWLNETIAREVSDSAEYEAIAHALHAEILASVAQDSDSGEFAESISIRKIRTRKGIRDYVVESDHPAALAIEYGHLAGKTDTDGRQLVPGKRHFTKAIKKIRKG